MFFQVAYELIWYQLHIWAGIGTVYCHSCKSKTWSAQWDVWISSPQVCFSNFSNDLAGLLQCLLTRKENELARELHFIGETETQRGRNLLPVACRQPPCAAEPCPLIQSVGRWGGQIYRVGRRARSGGCPSHGWPGSASPPSEHWRVREWTESYR